MEAIKSTFRSSEARPDLVAIRPEARDRAELSKDPIQTAQIEVERLRTHFESTIGPEKAALSKQHAQAQLKLKLLERVKGMDHETWSHHVDHTKTLLEHPENLTHEQAEDLKGWLEALQARPPHLDAPPALSAEQFATLATLLLVIDAACFSTDQEPVTSHDGAQSEPEQDEYLQQEARSQSYELEARKQLEATGALLAGIQRPVELEEAEARLQMLQQAQQERDILVDQAQRKIATQGYLERSQALQRSAKRMCEVKLAARNATVDEKVNIDREVKDLEAQFRKQFIELEQWDLNAKIARQGNDPYDGAVALTSPPELVRQYQLARHGTSDILKAYRELIPGVSDLTQLWNNLSVDGLKNLLREAKDFARDYPLEAADVAADLAHAYSILTLSGPFAEAQTVLERRTAQNQVIDTILGQNEALYSTGELKEISLRTLALMDLCSRAPYIAGVLMQDSMTGAKAAQAAAAWIPGLGHWAPVRLAAGTAGALTEVRAQKAAAQMISRKYEVMGQAMLRGLRAYPRGGYAGALQEAVNYAKTRQLLSTTGDIFRAAVEDRLTDQLLLGWRQNPALEAAKTGTSLATGYLTAAASFGSTMLATGGVVTAGAVAWPVLLGAGAFAVVRGGTHVVHQYFKSDKQKLSEKQQQTARRLQGAYDRMKAESSGLPIPTLSEADFKDAALAPHPHVAMVTTLEARLNEEQAQKYEPIAAAANSDTRTVQEVVTGLAAR